MSPQPSLLAELTSPLFTSLAPSEVAQVLENAVIEEVAAGERIIREGDYGDRMYVVEEGAAQVYATAFDGSDLVLARLEKGDTFGEQALLPHGNGRRNASVRAITPCKLRVITRDVFLHSLAHDSLVLTELRSSSLEHRNHRRERLREACFAAEGISPAADHYQLEQFRAGQEIFRQGDAGDRVYLILSGRAEVYREQEQQKTVLAELLPGQFFGELAILNHQPRAATVVAATDLETASLEGGWFRSACASHPMLRSLMDSLSSVYLLPNRGVLTLQTGSFEGEPSLTAVHNLPDGRRVLSTRLRQKPIFTSRLLEGPPGETVRFETPNGAECLELTIAAGKIVGIYSEGQWSGLSEMVSRMLGDVPVQPWEMLLFRERGDFHVEEVRPIYEDREVACSCKSVTWGQIRQAVKEDCQTIEAVAEKTGATLLCGGCEPLILEALGRSDWTAARVVQITPLSHDVRAFRIQPLCGSSRPHRPGQHILVQARIDNQWIQRAYTLSSAPDAGGVTRSP